MGSALAYRGIPLQSAYCAAKHALKGFNDSLQCELLHDRSRVRVQPELAARAILWAARHGGREVTVGAPGLIYTC